MIRKLFAIIVLTLILGACSTYESGEYYYLIHMKDGTKVKALSWYASEGTIGVKPPKDYGTYYYISPNEYTKIEYVGKKNIYTDKKQNKKQKYDY